MSEFDWLLDDAIVVRPQPAIAVYVNDLGAVVVRQERDWCDDDDTFIFIQPENARQVAEAIIKALPAAPAAKQPRQAQLQLEGAR